MNLSFKQFLDEARTLIFHIDEARSEESLYRSYVGNYVKKLGVQLTPSSRKGFHIRFPLKGSISDFNKFFAKAGIKVVETGAVLSKKYDTYLLIQRKPKKGVIIGSELMWVNSVTGLDTAAGAVFKTKELTPDALGLAGMQMKSDQIIANVSAKLEQKYDTKIAADLTRLMKRSKERKDTIKLANILNYNKKDLATISKDFGEVMTSIWIQSNMGFKESFFPDTSNARLIDIYGVRFGINYPISVKSGGGGKVTVQNIIDAIKNRAKTADKDNSDEKSLRIFNIVNNNNMRDGMIELHKEMDTPGIKKLASIMNVAVQDINQKSIKEFVKPYSNEELKKILAPFHKAVNSYVADNTWKQSDKLWFVISPLGESIWHILNDSAEIKKSLTAVARQVVLIQVNIDVKKALISFKHNRFKDAKFKFSWAGYSGGNKLGFLMELKH